MPDNPFNLDLSLLKEPDKSNIFSQDTGPYTSNPIAPNPFNLDMSRLREPDAIGTSKSNTYSPRYDLNLMDEKVASIQQRAEYITTDESPPRGVLSNLGRGLAEGLLGPLYDAPGPGEAATFSEELSYTLGTIGGSIPSFVLLSSITGGAGTPVAGARTASAVYQLSKLGRTARKINKTTKRLTQLKKAKDWKKKASIANEVAQLEKQKTSLKTTHNITRGAYDKLLDDFKREQIEKGVTGKALDNMLRKASFPQASGLLGRRKAYQEMIYSIGKKSPAKANYVNHLANNIATFGIHGLLMTDGGIEERLSSLDESAISALVFATAGIPRFTGMKGAKALEPAGVMLAGMGSDLGRSDMDWEQRFVSGLSLVGFHYAAQGLSNIGVKERQVQALVDLGYPMEKALTLVEYRNNGIMLNKFRDTLKKRGTKFLETADKNKMITVIRHIKGDKDNPERILYLDESNNTFGEVRGKNAWKKFSKKYEKFDPKNETLIDDAIKAGDPIPKGPSAEEVKASKSHKKKAGMFTRIMNRTRGFEVEEVFRVKNPKTGEQRWISKKEWEKPEYKKWESNDPKNKLTPEMKLENQKRVDNEINKIEEGILDLTIERDLIKDRHQELREMSPEQIGQLMREGGSQRYGEYNFGQGWTSLLTLKTIRKDLKSQRNLLARRKKTRDADINYWNSVSESYDLKTNRFLGTRYRPKLFTSTTGKRRTFYDIDNYGNPQDYVFKTQGEVNTWGQHNWAGKGANKVLETKRGFHLNEMEKLSGGKDYKGWVNEQNRLKGDFRSAGVDKKGRVDVINAFYPEAKGEMGNLSGEKIRRIRNVMVDRGPREWYERNYHHLPPEGFRGKVSVKWDKFQRATNRFLLPFSTYVEMLGSRISEHVSGITREHSLIRAAVAGKFTELQRDIAKVAGVPGREIARKMYPFLDEKYHFLQDAGWKKTLQNKQIETPDGTKTNAFDYILNRHRQVMDEVAKEMIANGVWVKDGSRGGKTTPFIEPVDTAGNKVKLVDPYKDPALFQAQVSSFIRWAAGERENVVVGRYKNGNEKVRNVNRKESSNHYKPEYMRRQVSEDFLNMIYFDADDGVLKSAWANRIAKSMVKKDKDIKNLRVKDELGNMVPATQRQKLEAAKAKWNEISNYIDPNGLVGQPWVRTAELDPYFFFSKKPDGRYVMLDIESPTNAKGELFKKGDMVEVDGKKVKIDRVISTYETDYAKSLRQYANGISHAIASYGSYSSKYGLEAWTDKTIKRGDIESYLSHINERIEEAHGTDYKNWINKGMRRQTFGEKREGILGKVADVGESVARFTAVAGLSSPTSGIKNLFLGNVQNSTVFTRRELIRGLGDTFGDYQGARNWADRIGASYTGAYELFFEPTIGTPQGLVHKLGLTGFMKPTEIFNRVVSSAIAPHALRGHVANLADMSVPHMTGVSKNTSLRILSDVFQFKDGQIADMIRRAKRQKDKGIEIDDLMFESHEMIKARQQAHIVTQGSPDLPYVPLWASEAWAKPLTLFYRIAYRITDTTARNVIKPILTNGNIAPAMKYIAGAGVTGATLYSMYDLLFDEERMNRFKGNDSIGPYLSMFIKAEGLGLLSNTFDDYGGIVDSYKPALYRNLQTIASNTWAIAEGKKTVPQAFGDTAKEVYALYNASMRTYENITNNTRKRMIESRRRQGQFMDTYHAKDPIDIDYDDALTTRTPYYRDVTTKFWLDDDEVEVKGKSYWVAVMSVRDHLIQDGYNHYVAEKEAKKRVDTAVSGQRPMPSSWRERKKGQKASYKKEYYSELTKKELPWLPLGMLYETGAEIIREEEELDKVYKNRLREFKAAARKYKNKYYYTWEQ